MSHYKRGRPKSASRACNMCGKKALKRDGNALPRDDGRSLKELPPPEPSKAYLPGKFKKDTKKWCGGHVGRPHDFKWIKETPRWGVKPYCAILVCTLCGRHSSYKDSCYHGGWVRSQTKPCICGLEWDE